MQKYGIEIASNLKEKRSKCQLTLFFPFHPTQEKTKTKEQDSALIEHISTEII